jgi:Fe2+ transport system protein FeoA
MRKMPKDIAIAPPALGTLQDAPPGSRVRISSLPADPEVSRRLRELGLHEGAVVTPILKGHGNLLCALRSARVGLDLRLAGTILVTPEE